MKKYDINFVSKFPVAVIFSALMIIASITMFFSKGLNYGVDFRGGAEVQVLFDKEIKLADLRSAIDKEGFKSSSVQRIGDLDKFEFLVKVNAGEKDLNAVTDKITKMLMTNFKDLDPEIEKTDIVGPKAGLNYYWCFCIN